jgi:hypothetical protein
VRSSLTGSFGGAVQNTDFSRAYPFLYTISAANTWEYKTITIPGDTTGTWLTTNGAGLRFRTSLGMGSDRAGPAGAWAGANYNSATGAVSVVGTSGATFYITGVQLEAGSVATPFERRPYGTELALCQRYYAVQRGAAQGYTNSTGSTGDITTPLYFPVTMRAIPTVTLGASDFTSSVTTLCDAFTTGYARFYIRPSTTGNQYDIGRVINLAAEL